MALETRLIQKLQQSLLMTPRLQQAIRLLQLGRLEYLEEIHKELLENPILEELRDQTDDLEAQTEEAHREDSSEDKLPENLDAVSLQKDDNPIDWDRYIEDLGENTKTHSNTQQKDWSQLPSLEATASRPHTLVEHLIEQVRLHELNKEEQEVALHVIGNLNRDGYLCVPCEEIAKSCKKPIDEVQKVLSIIQSLDPIGVAARNLQECLLIQLEDIGLGNGLEAMIIQKHFDLLEKKKLEEIARSEKTDVSKVIDAVTTIRSLEPRPGRPFFDDETRYVVPDVYIRKVSGEYVVSLNEDGMPKLRISSYYLDILRSSSPEDAQHRAYLNDKLKAASWLIKSIHQRQRTIFRVTESIVKFQRDFLDHGIEHLKPLVLKQVAEDIGMHESTISRVTTNKFVDTPRGVFELKFFFTTGLKTGEGEISSSSVKERIKHLIENEPSEKPLSDEKIAKFLKEDDIQIARRTVAKYREALGIPPSSKRRKRFSI